MTEERKIKAALQVDARQMPLPSDLLDRINQQADRVPSVRPGFWSRWRLGPKLELVAVCLLLIAFVGLAAVRNLNHRQAPAGGNPGSTTHVVAPDMPARRLYSGDTNDDTLAVSVVLDRQGTGDWHVVTAIQNGPGSTVELVYECDNLMRLDQSLIKKDCLPLPSVLLEPGQTRRDDLTVPGKYQGTPTTGALVYRVRSEGKEAPFRTLTVPIQEGVRQCCPEPNWTPSYIVARFLAAGVPTKLGDESAVKLFGATQIQAVIADGQNVDVYVFDTTLRAALALKTMQDPQAHMVQWAGSPQFFQTGNLVIQIDFSNAAAGEKLRAALFGAARP
ncbi:MAG: hypothetical protein JWN15_2013 [Firmicutes bacterium]|nr:hypothetical protein [Bacillota bacterium]